MSDYLSAQHASKVLGKNVEYKRKNTVKVAAHVRDGKPIAAYTRSMPEDEV